MSVGVIGDELLNDSVNNIDFFKYFQKKCPRSAIIWPLNTNRPLQVYTIDNVHCIYIDFQLCVNVQALMNETKVPEQLSRTIPHRVQWLLEDTNLLIQMALTSKLRELKAKYMISRITSKIDELKDVPYTELRNSIQEKLLKDKISIDQYNFVDMDTADCLCQ